MSFTLKDYSWAYPPCMGGKAFRLVTPENYATKQKNPAL
jgi:hypothetical protein